MAESRTPMPPVPDWPELESNLMTLLAREKADVGEASTEEVQSQPPPSGSSQRKKKAAATAAKINLSRMPKEQLRNALMNECAAEHKFIQSIGGNSKETKNKPLYKPSDLATQFLARNDLRPLRKRSVKFPRAQYFCHLCEYHCDTIEICISHIEDTRHSRLARKQELETTLYHLPRPSRQHLETLDNQLKKVESGLGLDANDIGLRNAITAKVDELLKHFLPGSSVRMYGSSLTGFGLKTSNLNLDLQIPAEIPPHLALMTAFDVLAKRPGEFHNVLPDFTAKIPAISFYFGGTRCELSLNNKMAYQTSALLKDYGRLDPRARVLGIALRYWANLCKVDRQAEGTLPPHCFPLLVIHFLQQLKTPVLPCIHEHLVSGKEDATIPEVYETPEDSLSTWRSANTSSSAELWIELLEYYAIGTSGNDDVISVRVAGGLSRELKQWKGRRMAIEDPFSTKRPLTRSVNSLRVLDFIEECFKIAYLYFGTVQTTSGPIVTKIVVQNKRPIRRSRKKDKDDNDIDEASGTKVDDEEEEEEQLSDGDDHDVSSVLEKLDISTSGETGATPGAAPPPNPKSAITLEELERSLLMKQDDEPDLDDGDGEDAPRPGETFESFVQRFGTELTPRQAQKVTELVPKNMIVFRFDGDILTMGQQPVFVCSVCGNDGHLQTSCPEEELPPIRVLPPLEGFYRQVLDRVCIDVVKGREPQQREIQAREVIVQDLTRFVRQYYKTARLTVFGSSVNGFAFAKSDLDISMTFDDHATADGLDSIEIIENLADKLKRVPGIYNVQAITSAKVPIIKFVHRDTQLEGDISLYNVLALENTHMLRAYSSMDKRVRILGYMVKEFAKKCDIGDASRGSLSSYAYILMMIHYLQKVEPPVVPVLQELHPPDNKPQNIIDGWDAWYFSDLANLSKVWPGLGKNDKSPGQLWLGFLDYYAAVFDVGRHVVCIRRSKPLSKFEKMWNSPCIAIEDPFDHGHNLGAGISRKMNMFIRKAFIRTRELFGIPILNPRATLRDFKNHLFNPELMTDGEPPNDRGCRACGKIGHLVRDCPRKKASEENKKNRQQQRQQQQQRKQQVARQQSNPSPLKKKEQQPEVQPQPQVPQPQPQPKAESSDFLAMLSAQGINPLLLQQQQPRPLPPQPQPPVPPPPSGVPGAADLFARQLPVGETLPNLPRDGAINLEDLERSFSNGAPSTTAGSGSGSGVPPPGFAQPPPHAPPPHSGLGLEGLLRIQSSRPPLSAAPGISAFLGSSPSSQTAAQAGWPMPTQPPPPPIGGLPGAFDSPFMGGLPNFGSVGPPPPTGMTPFGPPGGASASNPAAAMDKPPLQLNQLPSFNLFGGSGSQDLFSMKPGGGGFNPGPGQPQ